MFAFSIVARPLRTCFCSPAGVYSFPKNAAIQYYQKTAGAAVKIAGAESRWYYQGNVKTGSTPCGQYLCWHEVHGPTSKVGQSFSKVGRVPHLATPWMRPCSVYTTILQLHVHGFWLLVIHIPACPIDPPCSFAWLQRGHFLPSLRGPRNQASAKGGGR